MDVANVDDWLARFSPMGVFPFTSHKTQSIESRRARMSDLLIFDILLIRGGVRTPDVFFPPADWASLRTLLDVIDQSTYDILKKDCLVYILLKWAWDMDKETNPGWDTRFLQDRCIAPQFAALADAYWLLDTGIHLSKAVSLLSDARLNRDYVSKILQALSLSSSPASFASGTCPATAALVVKYVRTAKPLLTEPDDIDLYALSLAQLSFMDAWAYQRSFPEGHITRERLLGKIVGWCLMPTPKEGPLAQLLAYPLSSYEQSFLHAYALPSQFSTSSSLPNVNSRTSRPSKPVLSSQAISTLQDLLCVRAIQSGDYVNAIKIDHEFSSASSSLGGGASSGLTSQATLSGRDAIDRKSIIQDLFATLPPAERTLLEDEIGRVATGVRANASESTPRQNPAPARKPLVAELSLSSSWEDVGASMESPALGSLSSPATGPSFTSKAAPLPLPTIGKASKPPTSTSPFAPRASRPTFGLHAPPTPKFTAFGSPIPSATGASTTRAVITDRTKILFSSGAMGESSTTAKPAPRVSLFDTAGSAKNAPNAFYKPSSAATARPSIDENSALGSVGTSKCTGPASNTPKQNGRAHRGESDGEDVSMRFGSDVEITKGGHHDGPGGEKREEEAETDEGEDAGDFLTYEKSGMDDLAIHTRHVDEAMDEDHDEPELGFSVFSESGNAAQNGSVGGRGKKGVSGNERTSYVSPPHRAHVSSPRDGNKSLSASVASTTGRSRAPPGAFHSEEEDEEDAHDVHDVHEDGVSEDEDRHAPQTTPTPSPRRNTRTRIQSETPSRPSRSQPRRSSKSTTTTTIGSANRPSRSARTSNRSRDSHTIPGALMDEDHDEDGQGDADHDEDTEMDELEEEDDGIAPLPARTSRRTRSSGFFGTTSTSKSTSNKPTAAARAGGQAAANKSKGKGRLSETKTPTRRSSRLSVASSGSPDHTDLASPTKRRSTGSRVAVAGTGGGSAATRSSTRRKR